MKKLFRLLMSAVLIIAPIPTARVAAQTFNMSGGALTASATACSNTAGSGVVLNLLPTDSTATIQLSGTFVGTVSFFVSGNGGGAYTAVNGVPATSGASSATATAAGAWTFDVAGKTNLCAYASAYTSGTVNVGMTSVSARANTTSVPIPQALATNSTPTFAGVNQTTGSQFNGVTSKVFVTADFTTSGVGTNFEPITGLTWTLPASTAMNVPFGCTISWSTGTSGAAVAFGPGFSVAPTNVQTQGITQTNTTAVAFGSTAITTATSAAAVTGTPAVTTGLYAALDGFIENPSTTANVVTINVKTATAANTVTVKRGSYCTLRF